MNYFAWKLSNLYCAISKKDYQCLQWHGTCSAKCDYIYQSMKDAIWSTCYLAYNRNGNSFWPKSRIQHDESAFCMCIYVCVRVCLFISPQFSLTLAFCMSAQMSFTLALSRVLRSCSLDCRFIVSDSLSISGFVVSYIFIHRPDRLSLFATHVFFFVFSFAFHRTFSLSISQNIYWHKRSYRYSQPLLIQISDIIQLISDCL